MAEQSGKDFLVKIGDGASPETFNTVGGFRSNTITLNEETVDITSKASPDRFRELARFGIKSISVSGSGVFTDDSYIESARANYFGSVVKNWQVVIPDYGTFEGQFVLTSLDFSGDYNDAVQNSISLESAGTISFSAS